MENLHKIFGYTLLVMGLLLIVFPLYQTYTIFTGKALPAQIFTSQAVVPVQNPSAFDIQGQAQLAVMKLLPLDLIHNILNLSAWMILMVVLMFGGGQIANLGIKLLKQWKS